jgi:hypothetical protein
MRKTPCLSTLTSSAINKTLAILREEFCACICNLTPEQMQWRPKHRPDAWCIQQIVEHLLLTYSATSAILSERQAKGTPTRKPATLMQRCMQFTVTTVGYFPRGRQAPDFVQPPQSSAPRSGRELADTVAETIAALFTLIARCEEALGRRRSVTHGVMGPMSMEQWRRFQLVHARHHIRQIMAIRAEHNV